MNKKKVALIGYGYWGQKLYKYLQHSEDFHLEHVFFRSLKDLSEGNIKREYGGEFVSSMELIMGDKTVPNLIIATPVKTHYSLTKQALLNSKNVFVEKPLSPDPLHCKELLELANEQNLKLETDYTFTYSEALLATQRMVKEGAIGNIESISIARKQLGRFLEYDVYTLLGTHCLSILDMFTPIKGCNFYPKPLMNNKGVTTAANIYFESTNGACKGNIDVSLHSPKRENKVTIYGQKGTITYDTGAANTISSVCYPRFQPKEKNKVEITEEKVYTSDENHNLRLALIHFSKVLDGRVTDNSRRAEDITKVLSTF